MKTHTHLHFTAILAAAMLAATGAHALEVVAQGSAGSGSVQAATNMALQGKIGTNSMQLTATNAVVQQQAEKIETIIKELTTVKESLSQTNDLLTQTQTEVQQLKTPRSGSWCGYLGPYASIPCPGTVWNVNGNCPAGWASVFVMSHGDGWDSNLQAVEGGTACVKR